MSETKGNTTASDEELVERIVSRDVKFVGKVFTAEVMDVTLFDGSHSNREIVRHSGGATIVPLDSENNVYMVRQFRSPFEEVLLETPAGKLEAGEDPKLCAIRELKEETGFEADEVIDLGAHYSSPGYCSEILYTYLATGLHAGDSTPDNGEFLQVRKYPITTLLQMIDDGRLKDGKSVSAILKTARRLGL
ncbi:MAG TPA: NUDIX hydrolase [Bacillota bacterium]|nr:NUDIX hydrolase [Bacillota bacterium]HPE39076.1 NUDIX hydrolase [Bacillota bacterium]